MQEKDLRTAQKILNHDRQVLLASTAERAIEMTKHLGFSVVLVDLDMHYGVALIQHLHDSNPDLLIIAVKELGVIEVLRKPITPAWKPIVEQIRARRLA